MNRKTILVCVGLLDTVLGVGLMLADKQLLLPGAVLAVAGLGLAAFAALKVR